jgi:glucose 1-dehydrogenase
MIEWIERVTRHDFSGRVAIVTGAASGFGAGTARALAAAGASVVGVDVNSAGVENTAAEIRANGGICHPVAVDLTHAEAPSDIVRTAAGISGRVDLLANVAGIWEPHPFAELPTGSLDRQLAVNLRAPFLLAQAVVRQMREGSSIVFVSSVAGGPVGFPGSSAYCASKGAIWGLVKALGSELGPQGIRVNGVAPGTVETAINSASLAVPEHRQWVIDRTPDGRLGSVPEIVAAVVWLLSDASSFVNATTIVVDGAYSAV